jgi:uncharacterized protein YbaP (TraB family)
MMHTIQTAAMLLLLCLMPGRLVSAADLPEEIVIRGKVSGPPLWQVRHGENTLWIFGLLSPLPPDLELDTTRIESVLATADEALNEPDFDSTDSLGPIKMFRLYRQFRQTMANDNGATLQQVLPAELYQQLLTVKASHGPRSDKLLKVRPLMAAELLEGAAFKSVGLDEDTRHVNKRLLRLIRRHEVPLTEVVYQSDMSYSSVLEAISTVPYDTEISCLRAMLDGIETELAFQKERAEAWAYGKVGELYRTSSRSAQVACHDALTTPAALKSILQQTRELWLAHAERALADNRNTFALVNMQAILAPAGMIEELRDRGYEVIEP